MDHNKLWKILKEMGIPDHLTCLFVLEETQTGIKIAGRNINNLRYSDDTTLMALTALISHTSKVMLKILQSRLEQYVNLELPMFKLVLE